MEQSIAASQFHSPINMENSWASQCLSEKARSTMELWLYTDNTGEIEWCVDELDLVEHIGLVFEIDPSGKRTLSDYDGVFAIPDEAMSLLEECGVDCTDMRKSMAS